MKTLKKNTKTSIINILFMIIILLFETSNFAQQTPIIKLINNYLIYVAFIISFICVIVVFNQIKITIRLLLLLLLLFSCSIVSFIKTNDYLFLQLIVTIICSLEIPFDEIIRMDFKIKIMLLIYILFCFVLGLTSEDHFYRENVTRYTFGFNHPNTFAFFILIMFFDYVYINRENISKVSIFLISLLVMFFSELANSRSVIITIILFNILNILFYKTHCDNLFFKRIGWLVSIIFPILVFISIKLTIDYMNGLNYAIRLNQFLSSRLYMQMHYLKNYDITLFGNYIDYIITLDNTYLRMVINFGLLGVLMFSYLFNRIVSYSLKKEDTMLFIIITILLIYGLMEWYIIRPVLNIFLLYFSTYIYQKRKRKWKIHISIQ